MNNNNSNKDKYSRHISISTGIRAYLLDAEVTAFREFIFFFIFTLTIGISVHTNNGGVLH